MKKIQNRKFGKISTETLLVELKCFLQRPTESNVDILVDEMKNLVQGPKEVEYISTAPNIEQALSLEDLFK